MGAPRLGCWAFGIVTGARQRRPESSRPLRRTVARPLLAAAAEAGWRVVIVCIWISWLYKPSLQSLSSAEQAEPLGIERYPHASRYCKTAFFGEQ